MHLKILISVKTFYRETLLIKVTYKRIYIILEIGSIVHDFFLEFLNQPITEEGGKIQISKMV